MHGHTPPLTLALTVIMLFRRLIEEPDAHSVFPSPGTDLLPNPGLAPHPNMKAIPNPWLNESGLHLTAKYFDRGWNFELPGEGQKVPLVTASILVGAVPSGRPLEICFKATSQGVPGAIMVLAYGFDERGNRVYANTFREVLENGQPTTIRRPLLPCRDVRTLKLFFQRFTKGTIQMNKVRLIVGVPSVLPRTMDLCGAGLMYASARTHVMPNNNSSHGTLSFPIPIQHRNQVPVAFELSTTPQNALRGFRWEVLPDQTNVMCHAALDSPKSGVEVCWESLVFVDDDSSRQEHSHQHQQAALGLPQGWEHGDTTDSLGLRRVASSLYRSAKDLDDFAKLVERFARNKFSWARIAAAMFHLQNVPARVGIIVPADGGSQPRTHNFVEWYHPELGWSRLHPQEATEPTLNDQVIIRISSPDEMSQINHMTLVSYDDDCRELDYAKHFLSDDLSPIPQGQGKGSQVSLHAHPVMQLHHQKNQLNALRHACRRAWQRQVKDGRFGLSSSQRNIALLRAVREQDARGLLSALNK